MYVIKMVTSEKHQKALLGGLERLVGHDYPDLIPSVPKILMELYQADILDEEVITQWGTHVSKKYVDRETSKKVRKASEPFLKVCVRLCGRSSLLINIAHSGWKKLRTAKRKRKNSSLVVPALLCLHVDSFLRIALIPDNLLLFCVTVSAISLNLSDILLVLIQCSMTEIGYI